jgi:hypothetical protein
MYSEACSDDVDEVIDLLDQIDDFIVALLEALSSRATRFQVVSSGVTCYFTDKEFRHDLRGLQALRDELILSYNLEPVPEDKLEEEVTVEELLTVYEARHVEVEKPVMVSYQKHVTEEVQGCFDLVPSLVEQINTDFNALICFLKIEFQMPRKIEQNLRCNSLGEMHYEKINCPLVGGSKPRKGRRRRRRGRYRPKKNGNGEDGFNNNNRKPKTVVIGIDTELIYRGLGNGLPRSYDTIVRAFDNAFSRTNAGVAFMNWDYKASVINPVTGGASDINGDFLRTGYGYYRVTGFDIDVTFSAFEAYPIVLVLYPYGPFNTPTFTAVNTATLAEIRTVMNSRYSAVIPLGAVTGGNTVRTFRRKYTMDKILGESGVDWRSDNGFIAQVTGSPANRIGLFIGAYTETGAVLTTGVGVRMSFNTHVEMFSPIIS